MAKKTGTTKQGNTDKQKRGPKPAAEAQQLPAGKEPFPIVAVGASAGGLEAFEQFFKNLPPAPNAAFVVISHLDPRHSSIMTELISRFTPMTVQEITDGVEVEPDHVYVIPPNKNLSIFHGSLQLSELDRTAGTRMPIDFFMRSLAEDQGDRSVAVILSGTGSDGTLGLRDVQGSGGTVFVQDPASAKYDGMPGSAIRTGLADRILPVEEIPGQLMVLLERYHRHKEAPAEEAMPNVIQKILRVLRSKTGHDFSQYKKNTIIRRIERRIGVHNLENPAMYLRYLQEQPDEVQRLFKELLISVTSFFREPEAFNVLKKTVFPDLLHDKPSDYTVRVWVPGCATGEEAYSIAIAIREYAEEVKQDYRVQMFATDIDEDSIRQARTGFFPPNIALDVPAPRLAKFFVKEDTGFRVRKDIREMIVFAAQNVTKDAPFTKLDIVSCRNVLIYMEPDLQNKLITLFHYSLKPGGVLFLGSSETTGHLTDLFSSIDRKWKLFRAKPETGHEMRHYAASHSLPLDAASQDGAAPPRPLRRANLEEMAHRMLLSVFSPPAIIVNDKGEIVYIHGETGRYLRPAPGRPTFNIADMAREGLQTQVRTALLAAATHRQEAVYRSIRVKTNGGMETINLTVKPLPHGEGEEQLFMFVFQQTEGGKGTGRKTTGKGAATPDGRPRGGPGEGARLHERELAGYGRRRRRRATRSCVRPTRRCSRRTRSCNRRTRSWKHRRRSCSRSTKSW